MKTTATYQVSDFLSNNQIKKYNLQGCICRQSLFACDKSSTLELIDINGHSIPVYIKRLSSGKYVVKYL